MGTRDTSLIEVGAAELTLPGQADSGDTYTVRSFSNGVLVGVVDGLGHGAEAAAAARAAIATLNAYPEEPVIALLKRCHQALRGTRGVVMSLATFDAADGMLTWIGVGNVIGVLMCADGTLSLMRESLLLRSGVVGVQLPHLQAAVLSVTRGDTLIFATDGIRDDFAPQFLRAEPPKATAERILADHKRGNDDALVVVVRYLGVQP